jgi:hypothetical protein
MSRRPSLAVCTPVACVQRATEDRTDHVDRRRPPGAVETAASGQNSCERSKRSRAVKMAERCRACCAGILSRRSWPKMAELPAQGRGAAGARRRFRPLCWKRASGSLHSGCASRKVPVLAGSFRDLVRREDRGGGGEEEGGRGGGRWEKKREGETQGEVGRRKTEVERGSTVPAHPVAGSLCKPASLTIRDRLRR